MNQIYKECISSRWQKMRAECDLTKGSYVVNSLLKRYGDNKSTIMKCGFVC